MKTLITGFALALVLLAVGCNRTLTQVEKEPKLIAEKEGVKLWQVRVEGSNYPVYFTTPSGDTSWRQQQGKTSVNKEVPGVK